MNLLGTFIVGGILVLIVALIVRRLIKDKKEGKSCGCAGCKGCLKYD